ncbi:nucleoside-diphosphate-sugar epimerase [Kribbella sp. VKM Ac-2527]|uniref:Nucleoside-diphosphate-sugar epimerase n=1 Tax=Kribbella caucasensis TaxID=2512215 RepID=A0A4R6KLC8_9ACTN|nr:NAD(P)-dependent oxidoreductase [Kribbella sp. VKM Ac-2527]TDO51586.1 nucleoside-diphosphate-sugar epimerase [Kribbella sp. VKM Ac-2527]
MTVLVTGIGFVGAYIVRDLVQSGERVVLFGLFGGSPDGAGKYPDIDNARYIVGAAGWEQVTVVVGDIRDRDLLSRTIEIHDVTRIVHLASLVAAASEANIPRAIEVNIGGSVNVFETAVEHSVERVVWASSINVFGPRSISPAGVIDDTSVLDPQSTYGSTKAFLEQIARRYHDNSGLSVVGLRLGKVYGFGEHVKAGRGGGNTWFANLVENPARGIGPSIVPFGDHHLGFHYIEDVARSFLTALESRNGSGESFVTSGDYRPIREAFEFVRKVLPAAEMELVDGGEAAGLKPGAETNWALRYDASQAKKVLGIAPSYTMEEGLYRTISAYRAYVGLPPVDHPTTSSWSPRSTRP